jgi:hypothetical protein
VSYQSTSPSSTNLHLTDGSSMKTGSAVMQEDSYHLYSPEAILQWHQACLDLEPKLIAFGPVHSHDPASWLCFLAARRQVGRYVDAVAFVRDYFKNAPGAATMAPGVDPWRDCLAFHHHPSHSVYAATRSFGPCWMANWMILAGKT